MYKCIHPDEGGSRAKERNGMAVDPVCGKQVDEDEAAAGLEYEGDAYYFCSRKCMQKFKEDPAAYVKKSGE
jgi:Cu+-exporting ATPase